MELEEAIKTLKIIANKSDQPFKFAIETVLQAYKEAVKERDSIYQDYQELGKEFYNSISKKKIEKFIEEELPDDEICAVCDIYDVNGVEIKQKLQKLLEE